MCASRQLQAGDQYYFTPALLADLFNLERRQAYQRPAHLKKEGLADQIEVERRLIRYDITWSPERLQAALAQVAHDWDRDLRPLLPQLPAFEDVREGVTFFLSGP
jgi:hypothetical protein